MPKSIRFVLIVVFLLLLAACGAPEPEHTVQAGPSDFVNVGDMWYLPINQPGLPEANIEEIFLAIYNWQEQHPNLEILDVDYLYMQNTYSGSTSNYTYGISLLTAPK